LELTTPDWTELQRRLGEAQQRLAAHRASRAGGPGLPGGGEATGRGTAADGQITMVAAEGKLEQVSLDPRTLRLNPQALAQQLATAANGALDDLRMRMPSPGPMPPGSVEQVDLAALAKELAEVRRDGLGQMREIVWAVQEGTAQLARDAQVSGGVGMPDAEGLFEAMDKLLAPLTTARADAGANPDRGLDGASPDGGEPEARGHGQAAGGLVRAVAVPPGRVGGLAVDPRAVQAGSRELAGFTAAAINMALDDLGRQPIGGGTPALSAADRQELTRQVHELQAAALAQLAELGSSLSALMASMRPDQRRR
jgi:DNA-binding protein YbaB